MTWAPFRERPETGDGLPGDLQARIDGLNAGRLQRLGHPAAKKVQYEPLFSELGERWLEQWRRRPGRRPANTSAQYAATISLSAEWCDDRPIRLIKRADAARFVEEVVKRLPPSSPRSCVLLHGFDRETAAHKTACAVER